MPHRQEHSRPHWALTLVGSGIILSLMTLSVTVGRYAQRVDEIKSILDMNRQTALDNQRTLNDLSQEQAIQRTNGAAIEQRLAKMEGVIYGDRRPNVH